MFSSLKLFKFLALAGGLFVSLLIVRTSLAAHPLQNVQVVGEWSKCEDFYGGRSTPYLGDVDGDGQLDILAPSDREIHLLNARGEEKWSLSLTPEGYDCTLPDWLNTSPVAADLDGDGVKEVVAAVTLMFSSSDPSCNPCLRSCNDVVTKGVLYAINGKTGQKEWAYHTVPIYSSPAVADLDGDGRMEIIIGKGAYQEGGGEGGIMVLDAQGNLLWEYSAGNSVDSTPAIADLDGDGTKEVVFTSEDGALYVVSSTGELKWSASPSLIIPNGFCVGSISSSPAISDLDRDGKKEIVFGNDCGGVFAYSWDGHQLWQYRNERADSGGQFAHSIKSSASIGDFTHNRNKEIVIGQGYMQNEPGFVIALDAAGNELWVYQTRSDVWGTPAIVDINADGEDEILVADHTGWLYIFSPEGQLLEEKQLSNGVWASPVVGDIDKDGKLEGVISTGIDGTTPGNWCLDTLEFASSQVPRGSIPWGMFRQNKERTGFAATPFLDILENYWASYYIGKVYWDGITSGCSSVPLQYCPSPSVTRAQMAVFLERGIHGSDYQPPEVAHSSFGDVSDTSWAKDWIEALANDGITSGCGNGNYCPGDPVTRAQMAVFLLRAEHGADYQPPEVAHSSFNDVSDASWAKNWIEQLANEGITSGCGGGNYCPSGTVTRAQMAVFLVRTFNLP